MIYIFDVYGVAYLGNGLNGSLMAVFDTLRSTGARVVLASNMASGQKKLFWDGLGLKKHADDLYCSGDLNVAKPDAGFYSAVTTALKTDPESIVFFDDSAANVDAAKACGWQAFLYTDVPTTLEIIQNLRE